MKLIAKTTKGVEYLHSRKDCFYAPDSSAQKMADLMNKSKYDLKENELWYVYDNDYTSDLYCYRKLYFKNKSLKFVEI